MANEFDAAPSWQTNDDVWPHHFAWTAIYELPFGKRRKWVQSTPLRQVAGGWQLSWIYQYWIYQYQSGPSTSWSSRFFYGDASRIGELFNRGGAHATVIHTWFDPAIVDTGGGAVPSGFQGFEGRAAMRPGSFQVYIFPNLLNALAANGPRIWDINPQKKFTLTERPDRPSRWICRMPPTTPTSARPIPTRQTRISAESPARTGSAA